MNRVAAAVLYLLCLAAGLFVAYRPTLESGFARFQTDDGDSVLNHYTLEHSWRWVSDPGYCGTLLSPPFFHPTPQVLAYSENFLGVAPPYWALRLFLDVELAFPAWMLVMSALNFVAFAAAARAFGCNHLLAAFGAYLWAFGLVHLTHANHHQTIPRFWMPLAACSAWRLATTPALRHLNGVLAFTFLQVAACIYTGWFLAVGLAVFFPVAVLLTPGGVGGLRRFVAGRPAAVAGVTLGWAAALGLFVAPYLIANRDFERAGFEVLGMAPAPDAWIAGPTPSRWHDTLAPYTKDVHPECWVFSGFGLYALFAAALLTPFAAGRPLPGWRLVLACMVTVVACVLATMRLGEDESAWKWVRQVPGGKGIRVVSRVYVDVYLFGTLGAVVWLQRVTGRIPRPWVRVAVTLLVAAPVIYEQTGYPPPSLPRDEFYPRARACADLMRDADAGFFLPTVWTPGQHPFTHPHLVAMWAGLYANKPVMNGYSGRDPEKFPPRDWHLTDEQIREWYHFKGGFRGRVVVIDPAAMTAVRTLTVE